MPSRGELNTVLAQNYGLLVNRPTHFQIRKVQLEAPSQQEH